MSTATVTRTPQRHVDRVRLRPEGFTEADLIEARRLDREEDERASRERHKQNIADAKDRAERQTERTLAVRKAREARRALLLKRGCEAQLFDCCEGKAEVVTSDRVDRPIYEQHALCGPCAARLFIQG
jgi:hypothetical protein